jgi:hypothetical protein
MTLVQELTEMAERLLQVSALYPTNEDIALREAAEAILAVVSEAPGRVSDPRPDPLAHTGYWTE